MTRSCVLSSVVVLGFVVQPGVKTAAIAQTKPANGQQQKQKIARQVAAFVQQLGDSSEKTRKKAEAELSQIGKPAWSAVLDASKSPNELVQTAAKRILPRLRVHFRHFEFVDLQPNANTAIDADFHNHKDNNLKQLPQKVQVLGDARFRIQKKMIQLASTQAPDFPEKVTGITVGRKCTHIHFLHGTGWGSPDSVKDGTHIGSYRMNYEDGTTVELPIDFGDDVRDWWNWDDSRPTKRAKIAWTGKNPALEKYADRVSGLRLYQRTWKNPKPALKIKSIDFLSTNDTICAPFLVAASLEDATRASTPPKR